ncbi:Rho GTPase activation protein [Stereum hirsutum FP-91666 SS1]|uniref:Rho GTPase activation protein n=1 Tax=Stereum hirsutum (strain FP-91666) TaxID=721885 RepID=R7RZT4_STEHR|nr:Rho GTPase activation protein [Stereum hirsutum FP-91666 SS1]EIM79827.1 Rho GTPase activation protein [Stereum hirsutum FP-91666 SS1]
MYSVLLSKLTDFGPLSVTNGDEAQANVFKLDKLQSYPIQLTHFWYRGPDVPAIPTLFKSELVVTLRTLTLDVSNAVIASSLVNTNHLTSVELYDCFADSQPFLDLLLDHLQYGLYLEILRITIHTFSVSHKYSTTEVYWASLLSSPVLHLRSRISAQSKKNFVLERDVRYLETRIALLIQNRMALDEQREVESHLEEVDSTEGQYPDERKLQQYSNLFFLLQSEPRHVATLCRLISLSQIDTHLQTSVLSAQFDSATEFGSLLRANTPVSRMMTNYTRRGPGQSYLKSVLAERINSLIEHKDLNLEINPVKANPDVQSIIAPRLAMLMEIANSFLVTIIESMESVPYGICWICKQIRSLTRRKYPEATDYAICSLIGGFFFLHPAIETPQAYMLVDGMPAKHPRWTLTLIAKMLQNLANKPSNTKEAYMMTLNPFVEQQGADQPNTHSLITQRIETPHLRILTDELGPPPAQVPRKENRTLELKLYSRWETPVQDIQSAFADTVSSSDMLYMETKSIFVQLVHSIPNAAEKRRITWR